MSETVINQYENNFFSYSSKPDIVVDKYQIDLTKKIGNYSSRYFEMYEAFEINSKANSYMAAILNPRKMHRFSLMKYLCDNKSDKVITPLAGQIVLISDRNIYCVVLILQKHNYKTLYDYLFEDKNILSEDLIQGNLVPDIAVALKHIHKSEQVHGCLNLKNIFITSENNFIVNECFLEPCGFRQIPEFEPAERIKIDPEYKNTVDLSVDYYALGILCAYAASPNLNLLKYDSGSLIKSKIEQGTFQLLSEKINFPSLFKYLIRGLVADVAQERWGFSAVIDWCKGKKPSNRIFVNKNLMRPYKVMDKDYFDLTVLANDLIDNWAACRTILEDTRLHKWIEKTLSDDKTSERLRYGVQLMQAKHSIVKIDADSFITRSLIILDQIGPIRYKNLVFTLDSLSAVLANALTENKKENLNVIFNLIKDNLIEYTISLYNENNRPVEKNIAPCLDEVSFFLPRNETGFSLERMLYSLAPEFPCQSNLIIKYYVTTINRLLEVLEILAKNNESDKLIDIHIKNFIYAKLKITKPLRLTNININERFSSSKALDDLIVLSYLQSVLGGISLPNITKFMQNKLQDVIKLYYYKKTRENLAKDLVEISKSGDLEKMLLKIANPNLISKDMKDFMIASATYKALDRELNKITNQEKKVIFNKGHAIGLKVALMFSYVVCTFFTLGYTLLNINL